jgi:hypothetical protein
MNKEYRELREDVLDEQRAIEETLERLRKLRKQFDPRIKDYSTEPAMGTYLMNFYNGIENILRRISKTYYGTMPKGGSWHKELLRLSFHPPSGKIAAFDQEIVERLHAYRNFRHRFVSGYGFQLRGEKMLQLIDDLQILWADIERSIEEFWDKL